MIDDENLLELLKRNGRSSSAELAELLGASELEVDTAIARLESSGVILGYSAVIDPEKHAPHDVAALIEVRITPERGGGFDRIAQRIAHFDQVRACYLMSGGYDLAVLVDRQGPHDGGRDPGLPVAADQTGGRIRRHSDRVACSRAEPHGVAADRDTPGWFRDLLRVDVGGDRQSA